MPVVLPVYALKQLRVRKEQAMGHAFLLPNTIHNLQWNHPGRHAVWRANDTLRFRLEAEAMSSFHVCRLWRHVTSFPSLAHSRLGNANNFETHQACQHFCSAAGKLDQLVMPALRLLLACAAGEMIYRSRADEEPMDCSKEHCPSGFVCVSDMTNPERSVCCGTLNMGGP